MPAIAMGRACWPVPHGLEATLTATDAHQREGLPDMPHAGRSR